jgi:hypothetical protein
MSKPAKDEAELISLIDWTILEHENSPGSSASAVLASIRAAGWAVVPVEPTIEMFDAGHASSAHGHGIVALYRAMLAAAPGVET